MASTSSVVSVSDQVFHELHDRFDRGERDVCTGKSDGTNRHLTRGPDGFMRGPKGEIVVRQCEVEMMVLGNSSVNVVMGNRLVQKSLELVSEGYKFVEWVYGDQQTPLAKKYVHGVSGRTKTLKIEKLRNTDAVTCSHCGIVGVTMKLCAKCGDAHYCTKEHQVQAWKAHKKQCVPK